MLHPSRSDRARRRRLDRRSGYGAGYGLERLTIRDSRPWVGGQAHGRTLELAAGTGLNFPWYPSEVDLSAVDLDPDRLAVAATRAQALGQTAHLAVADGRRLPFDDDTFDAVVCTLALCDVDDRSGTLAELHRVLQPGGSLLLLDHLEPRWRHGRPATIAQQVGFTLVQRQRLWAGYFERVRLRRPS